MRAGAYRCDLCSLLFGGDASLPKQRERSLALGKVGSKWLAIGVVGGILPGLGLYNKAALECANH